MSKLFAPNILMDIFNDPMVFRITRFLLIPVWLPPWRATLRIIGVLSAVSLMLLLAVASSGDVRRFFSFETARFAAHRESGKLYRGMIAEGETVLFNFNHDDYHFSFPGPTDITVTRNYRVEVSSGNSMD